MTTEEARKCIKWDALVVGDNERAIFVAGVARESDCERAGVVPGQRLRALTSPVGDADKLWIISDTERLAFVKDAIRSTRAEEITFVLEKEITVTQEMVAAAMSEEERAEEEAREARAKAKNETPTRSRDANGKRIEDRPDLYTENWRAINSWVKGSGMNSPWGGGGDRGAVGYHRARDDDAGGALGRDAVLSHFSVLVVIQVTQEIINHNES